MEPCQMLGSAFWRVDPLDMLNKLKVSEEDNSEDASSMEYETLS